MQVKAESIDRKLILHLRGELDHHAARQLMQHIAVALHTMQQMKQLGGKMRIGNPEAQVKKVFTPAGLQQLIELEEGHEK